MRSTKDLLDSNTSQNEPKMTNKEKLEFMAECHNKQVGHLTGYDCPICKNRGNFLKVKFDEYYKDYIDYMTICECMKKRELIKNAENSGLGEYVHKKFEDYIAENDWQKAIKQKAVDYVKANDDKWFVMLGQSGCVDAETEYFNGKEWKKIKDYTECERVLQYKEDGSAELVYPQRYIKKPCETLYHIENKVGSINQTLSLDHNFVYEVKNRLYKMPLAEVIKRHNETKQGFCGKILTTFEYSGSGMDLTECEIRIMCAVICDGYLPKMNKNKVAINLKKKRKIERLRKLLALAQLDYAEYKISNGYSRFVFIPPIRTKLFSEKWYQCTNKQLAVVCDEILNWDGCISRGRKTFSTTVKQNADFVQFAFTSQGYRTSIHCYDRVGQMRNDYIRKSKEYSLIISTQRKLQLARTGGVGKPQFVEVKPIDGFQYCFTVDSGMLVLRRNGNIFITGNSGKTLVCSIIARHLLANKIVMYITWTDFISKLKRDMMGDNSNNVSEYLDYVKTVEVLFIDELLKKYNDTDLKYIIEIINYRYTNNLKTIITSERLLDELIDIDEATFSRVIEMSGGYLSVIPKDKTKNYRLRGLI